MHETSVSLGHILQDRKCLCVVSSLSHVCDTLPVGPNLGPKRLDERVHRKMHETMLRTEVENNPSDNPACLGCGLDTGLRQQAVKQPDRPSDGPRGSPPEAFWNGGMLDIPDPSHDDPLESGHLRVTGASLKVEEGNGPRPSQVNSPL